MQMNDFAIQVNGMSKMYRVGQAAPHKDIRDLVVSAATWPVRAMADLARTRDDAKRDKPGEFWALNDISFNVERGEVIGVIGRNGAGKSTLLKILSRITDPTNGEALIRGRVGTLLEVGTGFHPDLTGRENVYLNGTILGMRRREIRAKFDEIAAFADIEQFMDTPVKRYSSGMQVRLAFAVAAHLEPEILVVDEVLAVGDAAFQKKCIGKMKDVSGHGRTVLFVSHNMGAIQALCSRGILLDAGKVAFDGEVNACTQQYMRLAETDAVVGPDGWCNLDGFERIPQHAPIVKRIKVADATGEPATAITMGDAIRVSIEVDNIGSLENRYLALSVRSTQNQKLASINTNMVPPQQPGGRSNREVFHFDLDSIPFLPGEYWIDLTVVQRAKGIIDQVEHAAQVAVLEHDIYGSGDPPIAKHGVVYLSGRSTVEPA